MPLFKASGKLVYYAHVPKCGGTAIAYYLEDRFGHLGLYDPKYSKRPENARWTRSSPQHIDTQALESIFPIAIFDAVFAVVRHPVQRLISAYNFQIDVERLVPPGVGFSDWLEHLDVDKPYLYDNHVRPMAHVIPHGATIFHLEHGFDQLVCWLDYISGNSNGPRAVLPENQKKTSRNSDAASVKPSQTDLEKIAKLYSEDFIRFGYHPMQPRPISSAPLMTAEFLMARDRALVLANRPFARLRRKVSRKISRKIFHM